jgi:hypothetical protein
MELLTFIVFWNQTLHIYIPFSQPPPPPPLRCLAKSLSYISTYTLGGWHFEKVQETGDVITKCQPPNCACHVRNPGNLLSNAPDNQGCVKRSIL